MDSVLHVRYAPGKGVMSEMHSAAACVFAVGGPACSQAASRFDFLVIRFSANLSAGRPYIATLLIVSAPTPINSSKLSFSRSKALHRFSRTYSSKK